MFAPRPQTTHVPRHYTNTVKKTGGKNVDKENAGALPSKTPSKGGLGKGMLVPNTAKPLGKARGDEKGKGKEDDIAPKRLFASTSQSVKPSKSFSTLPTIRPIKTPAKTVRTPAPPRRQEVAATPLPSASKPRRSRQSLTPAVPLLDKAQFTTPSAKHWEEGESLESITEGVLELGLEGVEEEEGDGEVEWMPPRSEPLPHIPIGAPDCVAEELKVFNTLPVLWALRPTGELPPLPADEPTPLRPEPMCDDDELEEPMFRRPKAALPLTTSKGATTSRSVSARPIAAAASASTGSRLAPRPPTQSRTARPTASISRPVSTTRPSATLRPTSTSTRPLAHKSSTLSLNRVTKQTSTLSLKPVQDSSYSFSMPDLPEVEISLDFNL